MTVKIYSATDIMNVARTFGDASEYKTRRAIEAAGIAPDYVGAGTQFYAAETAKRILRLLADAALATLARQRDHAQLDLDESIAADFPHAVAHARAKLNAIESALAIIQDPEKFASVLARFEAKE